MPLVFIGGSGTEIGKTYVTAQLARCWPEALLAKPVLSGAGPDDDQHWLSTQSGRPVETLYAFTPPMAPWTAAQLAGQEIDIDRLRQSMAQWRQKKQALVEGVGSVAVPLAENVFWPDLLAPEDRFIMVIGLRLGSIGESLGCLAFLEARGRLPDALIFNALPGVEPEILMSSQREIEAHLGPLKALPRAMIDKEESLDASWFESFV